MSGRPRLTAKQKKAMKAKICEMLEIMPIITNACKKIGISRMTFCRWRKEDPKFDAEIEDLLFLSRESVNDLAEGKMIQEINKGSMVAIRFWLCHNSDRYRKKEEPKKLQIIKFALPRSPFMKGKKDH